VVFAALGSKRQLRGALRQLAPQRHVPGGRSAFPEDTNCGGLDRFAQCATRLAHGFVMRQRRGRVLLQCVDQHGKWRQGFVVWELRGEFQCRSGAGRVISLQRGRDVVAQHGVAAVYENVELL